MFVHGEEVQIGVQPIFPENQRNTEVGFFDLLLPQGAKQTIELEISNLSTEKPVVVLIEVATATTDNGGVVHYTSRRGEGEHIPDSSLVFAFEELVSAPQFIELAPEEARRVPITIQMPDVTFEGIIAGGFGISQKIDLKEAREEAGLILNLFNFEIPVLLRQSEHIVQPDLQILHIEASQWNLRNVIAIHLQNPEMMFINLMDLQVNVKDKVTNQVLVQHHETGLQMAPNSNFVFGVPLVGELFMEGDFILQMIVTARNGEWSFVEEFQIEANQAEVLNKIAVTERGIQEETSRGVQRTFLLYTLLAATLSVIIFAYVVKNEKRKHKEVREVAIREIIKRIGED